MYLLVNCAGKDPELVVPAYVTVRAIGVHFAYKFRFAFALYEAPTA